MVRVLFDELDEAFDDVDRFDLEMWFDNKYANKQYIMFGKSERWDRKGERARGYCDKVFNSLLEAIDNSMEGCGSCYLKIYEADYGRFYVHVSHHDGNIDLEIRELTNRGERMYLNHMYDYEYDIIPKLRDIPDYTRNVKFTTRYF